MTFDVDAFCQKTHFRGTALSDGGVVLLPARLGGSRMNLALPAEEASLSLVPAVLTIEAQDATAFVLLISLASNQPRYLTGMELTLDERTWQVIPGELAAMLSWHTQPRSEHLPVLFGVDGLYMLEALHNTRQPVLVRLIGSRGDLRFVMPEEMRRFVSGTYAALLAARGSRRMLRHGDPIQEL